MTGGSNLAAMAAALRGLQAQHGFAGDPADLDAMLALLRALYAAGRRDLPLGRLLEGHVDALQIVLRHAAPNQREQVAARVTNGAILGVWNADLPDDPLRLESGRLEGGKSFCSGAGVLTHALVTAASDAGRQLVLVDLAAAPAAVDTGWWRVVGMQRSQTHRVRWSRACAPTDLRIGAPDAYTREPWFSGGALRFTAVQAGGVAGVFDAAREHLTAAGRAGDPFQAARLADLLLCGERAASAVRRAARAWFAAASDEARLAQVSAARMEVADAGERAILLAQQSVGLQAMFVDHPLAARLGDLAVYLRQPGPDAQRLRVGAAAAAGVLAPAL